MSIAALVAAAAVALPGFHVYGESAGGGVLLRGVIPYASVTVPLSPSVIYLPPDFSTARRYPVVYLLHGLPGSPLEYVYALGLESWADQQIQAGTMEPFIAVAASASQTTSGEWAGPWEDYLVRGVVPWIDAHLPTIASARGRVLGGLSAGGFGAYDIGLHHPGMFGRLESWSGYFHPLRDGPFRNEDQARLEANDPWLILHLHAPQLRRVGMRFFLSTGPRHSYWEHPSETIAFARALRRAGLPVTIRRFSSPRGQWVEQFDAGLLWAFARA